MSGPGRSMRQATNDGDYYLIEMPGTRHRLEMPGCRGMQETIDAAEGWGWAYGPGRSFQPGDVVELRRVLDCTIGCQFLDVAHVRVLGARATFADDGT